MLSRYRPRFAFVFSFAVTIGAADLASGADVAMPVKAMPARPPVSAWTYKLTPYFWAPSLHGHSTIKGVTTDIDATFIDLLHRKIPKELFGMMAAFEMRNDRFAIFSDFAYMKLGASGDAARHVTLGRLTSASLGAAATVNFEMVIAELAAAYEIARWGSSASNTAIDIYGGGRLWWQRAEADLAVTAGLTIAGFTVTGGRAFSGGGDVTWVDPLVGLRLRHQLSPGHQLVLSGDVGGFGAGSDFSWQVVGAYSFDFAKTSLGVWSGMIGYRALYVDFSKGSGTTLYEYDMLQHGPIMGLSLKF
jgi:hypothetical protein